MSGSGNSSLSRLMGILSVDMGRNISKPSLPEPTKSTREVVQKPLEFQSVRRWTKGNSIQMTHMGKWKTIVALSPTPPSEKWSKGAIVNVTV